jgi:nucleotide-binding universal stress UspA family protein
MLSNERAIVVGVDGSPQARLALKWAADGARHRDVVLLMPSTGPGRGCSSMTQSD